ncbi:MAG: NADH:flavin oxidoreductase/NADH oxidase [Phycisphaerae bacterium]|nr:NADH:flavin oxidoreductase/NADH oxidase [Phycisphaerae bacterium]
MPNLLDPLTLRGVTMRNRIGVSPMCQYSSENGRATDWHLVHLGSRAIGGAGLIICEATAVEPRGRISPGDAGLWSDEQIEPLARINRFILEHGAIPAIQLAHAGRKASTAVPWEGDGVLTESQGGWECVGPSPIPFYDGDPRPRELTIDEIRKIQSAFVSATERALLADYRLLEIHGAHGYLIHSFHSPLSNVRTDEYGGSLENRIRFTMETVRLVRRAWPEDRPLAVRLSCTDWFEGGWTLEESVELARRLKAEGVDLIDCSSGAGTPKARIPAGASYQVPFAEAIRRQAEIPTAAVGLITDPMQADEVIRNGRADIVLLAREMLRDPYWPWHAAHTLRKADKVPMPVQYARACR